MSITRRQFVARASTVAAAAATLPRVAWTAAAAPADVIVIGAGLSGLDAALILEENGLKVLMLEGRADRVGGRVYTLFNVPGHPEAGGNTIAGAYGRMIAAGEKYGVPTVNLAPRFMKYGGQELYIGGEHIPLAAWPTHAANPFAGEMKKLPPWAWGGAMFKAHMPFKDLGAWADPANAAHDIPVHAFLAANGASEAAINLGFNTNISYGTTAHDVSLLQQASADHWQAVNRAAPAPGGPPGVPFIGAYQGGNQKLPMAMAARLKGDRLMAKRVVAIATTDAGASVQCDDGSRYSAKAVVCSLPFSVLRNIALDPLPPPVQLAAIQTLGYIPITQFHLVPKRAYWKDDGLAPSMWSDGLSGMILAQRFGATDDDVTSLTVWARGLNAQYLDRLGTADGARAVVAEIERLRPAAKGQLEVAAVHSWALDPYSAGDWAIFQPGQVTRYLATMSLPHKRVFFCGEHTAVASRGMEGAMESAERVALEVLTAVS